MIEREIEIEDGQDAIDNLDFEELCDIRCLRHEKAGDDVHEALCTVFKHLNGTLGISPEESVKLVLYNAVVALMSTPEYKEPA